MKIDPDLERELEVAQAAGARDRPIPVVIEHATRVTATPSGDREDALRAMEEHTNALQRGIVDQLLKLQARDIRQLTLVNAVAAQLTPPQVREMSERPDVGAIRLDRPQQVTA